MNISVITCVNDQMEYEQNVRASFPDNAQLLPILNASSAAAGLNEGMKKADNNIIVCCHQDVKFPEGWVDLLEDQLKTIGSFGIAGTFGIDMQGNYAGNIKDPHNNPSLGSLPCKAMSLDEHCLILNRKNDLYFDETLGGWHLYGADICLQASQAGLENYVINAKLEHLSGGKVDRKYRKIEKRFVKKWKGKTTLTAFRTTCSKISLL